MTRRLRRAAVAAVLGAAAAAAAVATVGVAHADTVICDQFGSLQIQGGRYVVQNNRWGTTATQCINVTATGLNVTQADGSKPFNGAPKSYPSVFLGCHFGNCSSSGNFLAPNGTAPNTPAGLQASNPAFAGVTTSVSMSYPGSGVFDAAYDIWFNQQQPTTSTQQNNGAEVMVWLNHTGTIQPVGSQVGTATINGATWNVWEGNTGWNVVSYVRQQTTTSLNFSVSSFFSDAVSRGFASNSWWLTSIQAGFEPWDGGVGLAVNTFSATAGNAPPPPPPTTAPPTTRPPTTQPPTTQPPGGGACRVTYGVQSQWATGFTTNITITNNGTSAINGWSLAFTLPAGQAITNFWNSTISPASGSMTARNLSYNATIGPSGGTQAFGFQASLSGAFSRPSAFTLNGTACSVG
jgi:hypothetical protein